jgi:hypothetical protein
MSTRFTALTIKEGDAFLLEDNGWNCLFDSGVDDKIVDLLKYKGINKLDLAICSHNDEDHAQGFIELLESGFKIDEIWLPGLWASILQYIKNHNIHSQEIECYNENDEKILDSLFSEISEYSKESEPCESIEETLSFFAKLEDEEEIDPFYHDSHQALANYVVDNPRIIAQYIADNLPNNLNDHLCKDDIEDFINDFKEVYCGRFFNRRIINYLYHLSLNNSIESFKNEIANYFNKGFIKEWNKNSIEDSIAASLDFKLKRIEKLAGLAYQKGCSIKWFEPGRTCVNINRSIDHGFMALNSNKVSRIKQIKGPVTYFYALSLSKENRYSLVYEYWKNRIPVIRFSADSRITCQSQSRYKENIIVTAPHHGSAANAVVYKKLQGDDIIWVRSDTVTGGTGTKPRPCDAFQSMKNKYCLACEAFNFISEICFEYDPCHKKWQHIRGEQCRCK